MIRIILSILYRLILLVLVLLVLGYFTFATTLGSRAVILLASKFLPGTLNIQQIKGRLSADITFKNVVYHDRDFLIESKNLHLVWHPWQLLNKKVVIEGITSEGTTISLTSVKSSESSLSHDKSQEINVDSLSKLFKYLLIKRMSFNFHSKSTWSAHSQQVDLQLTELNGQLNHYPLKGFVFIQFNNGEITIHESRIDIANSQAKLSGTLKQNWNMQWQLHISELNNIIPDSFGSIASSGSVIGPAKYPEIQANIKAANLSIANIKVEKLLGIVSSKVKSNNTLVNFAATNVNFNDYVIPSLNLKLDSQLNQDQLISKLILSLSEANQMRGVIILPKFSSFSDWSQPVRGKIYIDFKQLRELLRKIPEVDNLQGNLQGVIEMNGRLDHPRFSINSLVNKGQLFIPKLGITLSNINLRANYDDNQVIKLMGNFVSGSGKGNINGLIDLHAVGYPTRLWLQGNNLQIVNLPEYKINASPDLSLEYNNQINIQGNIGIPYAEINPKDLSNVITLPSEVVFVHTQNPKPSFMPTNFSMHIQIVLGDKIHLSYENLQADLGGKLTIQQNVGSPVTATGELYAIKGRYRAYGKLLSIQEGRLIYAGNILTNPGLYIRAIQRIETVGLAEQASVFENNDQLKSMHTGTETITVGVWVKGTFEKPELSLFSDPAGMSKNDILSYLVFGYPQSQISKSSSLALLNNIASSFNVGGSGVEGKAEKIKTKLGLTELNLGSTEVFDPNAKNYTTNTATFTVGKKVGRNLYLRYSIGLFDSVQILSLKYQITNRLSIQTETSSFNNNTDNGADILYEFETD